MDKASEKYRGWMMAITFAEAGEWDMARQMIPPPGRTRLESLQKTFMAAAFAEEGLHEEALRIMSEQPYAYHNTMEDFLNAIGLRGVPVTYAVLNARAN